MAKWVARCCSERVHLTRCAFGRQVPGGVISTFSRVCVSLDLVNFSLASVVDIVPSSLTPVLATRFLAHLRDVDRDERMSSLGVSQLPSMQINPPTVIRGRGLSSVSGVLDFGDMDDSAEERVGAEVGDDFEMQRTEGIGSQGVAPDA